MPQPETDRVVKSASREALAALVCWLVALAYTVPYCYVYGYNRTLESLKFVCGVPDWVFWGIFLPWGVCILLSCLFAAIFMRDEDLGEELPEQEDELGLGGN